MGSPIILNNFSGGMRQDASHYQQNECASISGLWHQNTDLEPMAGPSTTIAGTTATNERGELTVFSHAPYVGADGQTYIQARRASSLWTAAPPTFDRPYNASTQCLVDMRDSTPDYLYDITAGHVFVYATGTSIKKLWSGNVRNMSGTASMAFNSTSLANMTATDSFTVELWIRCTGSIGTGYMGLYPLYTLASKYDGTGGYHMYINRANGKLVALVAQNYGAGTYVKSTGTTNLFDSTWHHVAFTYAPNTYPILYIDGVAETVTNTGTPGALNCGAGSVNLKVGCFVADWFQGDVGTFSVEKSQLSAAAVLANYNAEVARYQTAPTVTYTWYPLHAGSQSGDGSFGSIPYLRERTQTYGNRESFAQVGNYVYCASDEPSDTDYVLVSRTCPLRRGQVQGTAGSGSSGYFDLVNTHYPWTNEDIKPGDTIYIKTAASGWLLTGYVIKNVSADATEQRVYVYDQGVSTTGLGTAGSNYVDYCIVRCHRPGVSAATPAITATVLGTGTGLSGTYTYMWRWRNLSTGYDGKFSGPSAAVSPSGKDVSVAGWPTTLPDYDIDTFEIWRANATTGVYYLVKTVSLLTTTTISSKTYSIRNAPAASYTDNGWANGTQLTDANATSASYYDRPGAYSNVRVFNQRLYASYLNREVMSALDAYEYMPLIEHDDPSVTITSTQLLEGGTIDIGASRAEPVTAHISEAGSWSTDGISGSNMLIFTKKRAFRWSISTNLDANLSSAFNVGCINQHTLVNAGGLLMWLTGEYIVAMPAGSTQPQIVSQKIWPYGIRKYITAADVERCLTSWSAAYYDGWYVITGSLSAYEPDTTWLCRLPMGGDASAWTWTSYPYGFLDLAAWDRPGSAGGQIVSGSTPTGTGATGNIQSLWKDTASYNWSMLTQPLHFSENILDEVKWKGAERVSAMWLNPTTANATVTMQGYRDGDMDTPVSAAQSKVIPYVTTRNKRSLTHWGSLGDGRFMQLKVAGTGTSAARLEAIMVEPNRMGRKRA